MKVNYTVEIDESIDTEIDLDDFIHNLDDDAIEYIRSEVFDNQCDIDKSYWEDNTMEFKRQNSIPDHCTIELKSLYDVQKMEILLSLFKESDLNMLEKLYEQSKK